MVEPERTNQEIPCILLSKLGVTYRTARGHIEAIKDINLTVYEGEFISILGPTGCGKSTILRVVSDLIPPSSGIVKVRAQPAHIAREKNDFGFVFQEPVLLPWRTALDNIKLPLEIVNFPLDKRKERCLELLDRVGLSKFAESYPNEMSGGMKQRVSIVRALSWGPSILLMDEPFSALDELTRNQLQQDLLNLWELEKKTVLFVTHNLSEAVFLADRIVIMSAHPGKINSIMNVNLPRPRTEEIRDSNEFLEIIRSAREVLRS